MPLQVRLEPYIDHQFNTRIPRGESATAFQVEGALPSRDAGRLSLDGTDLRGQLALSVSDGAGFGCGSWSGQQPAGLNIPRQFYRSLLAGRDGKLFGSAPTVNWTSGKGWRPAPPYPGLAPPRYSTAYEDREGTRLGRPPQAALAQCLRRSGTGAARCRGGWESRETYEWKSIGQPGQFVGGAETGLGDGKTGPAQTSTRSRWSRQVISEAAVVTYDRHGYGCFLLFVFKQLSDGRIEAVSGFWR